MKITHGDVFLVVNCPITAINWTLGPKTERSGAIELELGSSTSVSATKKDTTDENGDYHNLLMQKHDHSFHPEVT